MMNKVRPKKADGTTRDHGKGQHTEFPPLMSRNKETQKGTKWTKRRKQKTSRTIQSAVTQGKRDVKKMQVASSIKH